MVKRLNFRMRIKGTRLRTIGLLGGILALTACSLLGQSINPTPQPASVTLAASSATAFPPATFTASPASPTASVSEATGTPEQASVATFPDPGNYQWSQVASGLQLPVDIQNADDGSGRLFIVEKPGRIRILQNGQLLPTPFLDISSEVRSSGSEQGLLGLAFHPDCAQNGLFFVNYIDLDGNTVIARFQVSAQNPNQADPSSEAHLIQVKQPFANHNGGGMVFGPDGYLYLGLGDGGSGGDPLGNAQSTNTLLGKLLRIDVDHGDLYAIPPDNPFANGGGSGEIWAFGLRNPWRFSFDHTTGDLYIGDVGQSSWEEIDFLPAGSLGGTNFGWNYREGLHAYQDQLPAGVKPVDPVVEYGHDQGCAVTGGVVYRGQELPAWRGIYLYSDYCSGLVWGLLNVDGHWQTQLLFRTGLNVSSFGQDQSGEVYLADYGGGAIYRLQSH
jgi:glucose/arabinose dehydrogenase